MTAKVVPQTKETSRGLTEIIEEETTGKNNRNMV